MKGLILALQFLTRIPTPKIPATNTEFAASMRWFPVAGLFVGGAVTGAAWLGACLDDWCAALAALVAWVLITGALHLDGLSDLADVSGAAHKDRDRLLAVLADPHLGSFGAVALMLQLIAKLVLLHSAISAVWWPALLLIPFAARIGPLVWTIALPPLHAGLADKFRPAIRRIDVALWIAILFATGWVFPAILVTPVLIIVWGWYLVHKFGGISGDGHGAGIELIETGLLLTTVVWAKLA